MAELSTSNADYSGIHGDIVSLLDAARRATARSVNALRPPLIGKLAGASWSLSRAGRNTLHVASSY